MATKFMEIGLGHRCIEKDGSKIEPETSDSNSYVERDSTRHDTSFEPESTTMGARVRHLRKTLALSQTALAKLAGVTQPVISDLEANRTHTSGRTASIAAALGVNALWLETGQTGVRNLLQESDADDMLTIPVIVAPGNCGGRGSQGKTTKETT